MKLVKDRKGVSPVVGVMLMLVVTVILAAAVNAYTNSISPQKPAPVAEFDAKASIHDKNITLVMLSGPPIQKSDIYIKITTSEPLTSGYVNMSNVTFYHANQTNAQFVVPGDIIKIHFTTGIDTYSSPPRAYADFSGPQIQLWIYEGSPFTLTIIDKDTGNPIWTGHLYMNP